MEKEHKLPYYLLFPNNEAAVDKAIEKKKQLEAEDLEHEYVIIGAVGKCNDNCKVTTLFYGYQKVNRETRDLVSYIIYRNDELYLEEKEVSELAHLVTLFLQHSYEMSHEHKTNLLEFPVIEAFAITQVAEHSRLKGQK